MLHHFNLAAKLNARTQGWKSIHTLWRGIDRGKIVTLLELDNCFFDPTTLRHRGAVGMRFVANGTLVNSALQNQINNGTDLFDFPSSLASDETKKALESEIIRVIAATESPAHWDLDDIEKRIHDHVENSRLQAMVLDDYLNTINRAFSIIGTASFEAVLSAGGEAEAVLKAINALPDHRHLFPDHGGPQNGKRNDQKNPCPNDGQPRILRPVLFPA